MPTAKQFKDLFADSKAYGDDVKITIGDVETTLGDIRSLTKAEQARVAADAARVAEEQATLLKAQQNLANNFAALVDKGLVSVDKDGNLVPADPATIRVSGDRSTNAGTKKGVDYETDTYVGPIYKQLQDLQKQVLDSQQRLEKALNGTRALVENDRLRREYDAREWPEGTNFDAVLRETAARKYSDPYGRLDVAKYHEEVSKPVRMSQKEFEEAVTKKADELARERVAAMPRPGTGRRQATSTPQFKNLDEAMTAAAQDPDIVDSLQQIVPGLQ